MGIENQTSCVLCRIFGFQLNRKSLKNILKFDIVFTRKANISQDFYFVERCLNFVFKKKFHQCLASKNISCSSAVINFYPTSRISIVTCKKSIMRTIYNFLRKSKAQSSQRIETSFTYRNRMENVNATTQSLFTLSKKN